MTQKFSTGRQGAPALWITWLLWVAVSAVIPALGVLQWVFLQRKFGLHLQGQWTFVGLAVIALAAMPAILQWAVLRRLAPGLSFPIWVGASWISAIAVACLFSFGIGWLDGERAFAIARVREGLLGVSISWLHLMLYGAVVALLFNLVPIASLGGLVHRRWSGFLWATVAGVCVALIIYRLAPFRPWFPQRSFFYPLDYNGAQAPWNELISFTMTFIALGAVQGAIGGWGLMRMFEKPEPGPTANGRGGNAAPL
jgi:hypothetical protein